MYVHFLTPVYTYSSTQDMQAVCTHTITAVAVPTAVGGRAVESGTRDSGPGRLAGALCAPALPVTSALWVQTLHVMHTQSSGHCTRTSVLAFTHTGREGDINVVMGQGNNFYHSKYTVVYTQCIYMYNVYYTCTCNNTAALLQCIIHLQYMYMYIYSNFTFPYNYTHACIHVHVHSLYVYTYIWMCIFLISKMTLLLCLVCLFDLACFFLSSLI